jgi:prophage antirepressor-like protein
MENKLQLFEYNGQPVRVVWIGNDPMPVLVDTCKILEIGNPSDALKRLLFKDGVAQSEVTDRLGRKQPTTIISLPNYLDFVARSDTEPAVEFRKWVWGEVMPTILKTGSYSLNNEEDLLKSQLGMMQFAQNVVQKIVTAVSARWILDNPKRAPYAYIMLCYMRTLFHHAARSYEGAIELLHGKECIPAIKGDIVKLVADIQNGKSTIQLQFPFEDEE